MIGQAVLKEDSLTDYRIGGDYFVLQDFANKYSGGSGHIVEINESLFGKRKYECGDLVGRHQQWVLGGVDRMT